MAEATSQRLPAWCAGDDWCPVTCTAAIIGKKWHPVIVDRLLAEETLRFSELQSSIDGVSSKVLSESLADLEEKHLVDRTVIEERPPRVEYSLTPHGEGLEPVIDAMVAWGREYLVETPDRAESVA